MTSMPKVDIAFLFPPGRGFGGFQHHLGVAYIQAMLARRGVRSTQIVPPAGTTIDESVDRMLAVEPRIVGFTCFDANLFLVRILAQKVKERCRDVLVVAGGPTATFSDRLLLARIPALDVCVRFEGEETTLELASRLLNGGSPERLEDIDGLSFRRNGELIRTPDRRLLRGDGERAKELDRLPSPYLEGILDGTERAGVITGRGCVHRCTFCNFSAMSRHTTRVHSVDRVLAELRRIATTFEGGTTGGALPPAVDLYDDAFSLHPSRAREICRRIIDEGSRLRLRCLCRADNLDEELIDLLHRAGFDELSMGLESAVPRVLRGIKKVQCRPPATDKEDFQPEKRFLARIEAAVAIAKKKGMRTALSIVLGLPGESLEDGLRTVDFVRRLNVDRYSHNFLTPFPGTEIFERREEQGLQIEASPWLLPFRLTYSYPVDRVPIGDNARHLKLTGRIARGILTAFCGFSLGRDGAGQGISVALVEDDAGDDWSGRLQWLARSLRVGGKVILLGEAGSGPRNGASFQRSCVGSGIPTREICLLRQGGDGAEGIEYEPVGLERPWPRMRIRMTPLAAAGDAQMADKGARRIYLLKERNDVELLASLARADGRCAAGRPAWRERFLDGVILDGCRWSQGTCPALRLRRIVIDGSGAVRPCLTGEPLGREPVGVEELRRRAGAIYRRTVARRRCARCPAETWCSRCLFPDPLSEEEFCELQRRSAETARLVLGTHLLHTYYPGAEEEL